MATATTNNALDFRDPGPMNEELLYVPGFVNDLTEYTLRSGYSPNRTLALHMCDMINEEQESYRKTTYSLNMAA